MSDISISPVPDRSLIIFKKLQNRFPEYKRYKEGEDIKQNSAIIYNEITKRSKIIVANMKAAVQNLIDYNMDKESKEAEMIVNDILSLGDIEKDFLKNEKSVTANQEEIKILYNMDEYVVDNLFNLQDNVNTFRSASISGEFERNVLEKIKSNIREIRSSWEERKKFFSSKV